MSDRMRISVLWAPFDPLFYFNMKTKAVMAGLGDDTGRLLQFAAIQRIFSGNVRIMSPALGPDAINAASDLVVIAGGAPAMFKSLGVDKNFLNQLTKPVVALDLTADKAAAHVPWLTALAAKNTVNIWVNSLHDQAVLADLGIKSAAGASVTQFINSSPDLGGRVADFWSRRNAMETICVVAGQGNQTRPPERDLLALAFDGALHGGYFVQQGLAALHIARGEFGAVTKADIAALQHRAQPDITAGAFRLFCRNHLRASFNAAAWMESYRGYDLVVGASFQAVALALQTQRMGLAIVDTPGFEGACAMAGLPYIRATDFAPGASRAYLQSVINFTPERYKTIRQKSAQGFLTFAKANQIRLHPPFMRLVE